MSEADADQNIISNTVKQKLVSIRPFVIALVNLGEVGKIDLDKLAKILNKSQVGKNKLFQFHSVKDGVKSLGEYDLPHNYSNKKLFNLLSDGLDGTGISYGIGVTVEDLEYSRFNVHLKEKGLGLVSAHNNDEYRPSDVSLNQYLAYLILCEAFCITGHYHFEHNATHYCLFDECANKKDFKECLQTPQIHCFDALEAAGFTKADFINANAILKYVKKRSLMNALFKTFNNPLVGVFLGGTIVNIFSGKITELGSFWRGSITVSMLLFILGAFLSNYFPLKKK